MANATFPSRHTLPLLPPPDKPMLAPLPPLFSHPLLSDSNLTIIAPVIAYWALSLIFELIDYFDFFAKHRLHTPEEVLRRNKVSKKDVAYWVFIQQVLQMCFAWVLTIWDGVEMTGHEDWDVYKWYLRVVGFENWAVKGLMLLGIDGIGLEQKVGQGLLGLSSLMSRMNFVGSGIPDTTLGAMLDWRMGVAWALYWYIIPAMRFWVALFLLDTWQYFLHRIMHSVPSLYRAIHSHHHRLYCPYAFGALYNHPLEGFLMDTIGAGMSFKISGMSQRGSIAYFVFGTLKTVDDHCGYKLPWDPLQWLFWNNAEYHDIHHQSWGIKTNFSQPFFICWDRWLDTQWVGGDANKKRKEKALKVSRGEKSSGEESDNSNHQSKTDTTLPSRNVSSIEKITPVFVSNGEIKTLNGRMRRAVGANDEDSGWDSNSSGGDEHISATIKRRMAAAR